MQREQLSIPKIVLYILFALLIYVLQTSLFGTWSIRGYHLDLLPALWLRPPCWTARWRA